MGALDPVTCTRCKTSVAADDPARPASISSRTFLPQNPRPVMPGGTRADGTVVGPTEVTWTIEGDYQDYDPEGVYALLCRSCVDQLCTWIYSR